MVRRSPFPDGAVPARTGKCLAAPPGPLKGFYSPVLLCRGSTGHEGTCWSAHEHPSVDVDRLAGDVSGILRREEQQEVCDVVVRPGATQWNTLDPFGHELAGGVIAEQAAPFAVVV